MTTDIRTFEDKMGGFVLMYKLNGEIITEVQQDREGCEMSVMDSLVGTAIEVSFPKLFCACKIDGKYVASGVHRNLGYGTHSIAFIIDNGPRIEPQTGSGKIWVNQGLILSWKVMAPTIPLPPEAELLVSYYTLKEFIPKGQ